MFGQVTRKCIQMFRCWQSFGDWYFNAPLNRLYAIAKYPRKMCHQTFSIAHSLLQIPCSKQKNVCKNIKKAYHFWNHRYECMWIFVMDEIFFQTAIECTLENKVWLKWYIFSLTPFHFNSYAFKFNSKHIYLLCTVILIVSKKLIVNLWKWIEKECCSFRNSDSFF